MKSNSGPFPPHVLRQAVWLRVALSDRFNAEQVQRWHRRLQAYLTARGLVAAISPQRIAIVRSGGAISPFDRGMVVGWLIAQPEVVFVHIERRPFAQQTAAAQEVSHA